MTRIVAGRAGGRTLAVPPRGTRPTSDRVREALFSRLDHAGVLRGARVLDLYAGSGALGLEAASRGAREVVLVEVARAAADVCRRNVATLGLAGVRVAHERALTFLQRAAAAGGVGDGAGVDVALVDPPYDLPEADLGAVLAALVDHLTPGATVVVERSSRSPEPTWPVPGGPAGRGLVATADRRYGETVLWFARAVVGEATAQPPAAHAGAAAEGRAAGASPAADAGPAFGAGPADGGTGTGAPMPKVAP